MGRQPRSEEMVTNGGSVIGDRLQECGEASGDERCGRRLVRRKCSPCRTPVNAIVAGVLAVWMFLGLLSTVAATTMGEDCDWFGSGLSGPERGVSPVYLRCAQGRVRWAYPRGALRVLLRLGGSGADFRGCVRLGPRAAGARLFLEGPRSLAPLFHDGEEEGEEERQFLDGEVKGGVPQCFQSRAGVAVLYLEAKSSEAPLTQVSIELFYRLQPSPSTALDHSDDECRPCTPEEMLHLYCTGDFVARGAISAVRAASGQRSAVHVVANAVLRQTSPVFDDPSGDPPRRRGVLLLPSRCGATHGPGEFLFLGRVELGQARLTCAPQLHEWALVRAHALSCGTNKCSLDW